MIFSNYWSEHFSGTAKNILWNIVYEYKSHLFPSIMAPTLKFLFPRNYFIKLKLYMIICILFSHTWTQFKSYYSLGLWKPYSLPKYKYNKMKISNNTKWLVACHICFRYSGKVHF